jgi:hypothetical protein
MIRSIIKINQVDFLIITFLTLLFFMTFIILISFCALFLPQLPLLLAWAHRHFD